MPNINNSMSFFPRGKSGTVFAGEHRKHFSFFFLFRHYGLVTNRALRLYLAFLLRL